MADATVAATRWAFLGGWLRTLQTHLYYHEREELDCGSLHSELKSFCVYIPWPPEETDAYARKVAQLREAMELVGLALRIDRDVWQFIAQPGNPAIEGFDPNDYEVGDLTPRFLVKAYSRDCLPGDTVETIAVVEQLLVSTKRAGISMSFKQARAKIYEMDTRAYLRDFVLPISILFTPTATASYETARKYMDMVSEISLAMRERHERAMTSGVDGAEWYPFKLTSIVFHPWDFTGSFGGDKGGHVNAFLLGTLTREIAIPEIGLKPSDLAPVHLGMSLHTICHAPRLFYGKHLHKRVESLMVTGSTELEPFLATCSAIASATTLSRLQLYSAFAGDRSAKWRALGFALLSRASTSSVCELYIDEDTLLLSDAAALQQTAKSNHAIQDLVRSRTSAQEYDPVDRKVRLWDGAKIRLRLDEEDISLAPLSMSSSTSFDVVDNEDGSEWLRILVPECGIVYARCEDIVDAEIVEPDPTNEQLSRLTQVHIAFNQCEPGAFASIVRSIGASLASLNIDVKDSKLIGSNDVDTILDTCRTLKLLRLRRASIDSMALFTRAYEEKHCRISTLSLWNVYVSNTSLHDFALALGDASHRMAKTLIEFRYIFDDVGCPGDVSRPDGRGVELFLRMLARNATLSFFELGLGKMLYKRYADQFHARDGQVLVSHASDLALASKLAFVSCVSVSSGRSAKRRRASVSDARLGGIVLTRDLVEHIFLFARKRLHRVVSATPIVGRTKVLM